MSDNHITKWEELRHFVEFDLHDQGNLHRRIRNILVNAGASADQIPSGLEGIARFVGVPEEKIGPGLLKLDELERSVKRWVARKTADSIVLGSGQSETLAVDSREPGERQDDGPKKSPPEPSREAFMAYRVHVQGGKTQEETGRLLAETYTGSSFDQYKVSRLVARVRTWLDAGNKLPGLGETTEKPAPAVPMDPNKLDLGPRVDHRPAHQRQKRSEIERDGWNG